MRNLDALAFARRSSLATCLVTGALTVAFAVGCASSAPPAAAAPSADSPNEIAPYPFTVTDIRLGCPMGRTIDYLIEEAGKSPHVEHWAFTPLDDETVKITTTSYDAVGNPIGDPAVESSKWTELHEHARFPHAATKISNETITVPAGTFDAMHYEVTAGNMVKNFWFARTLPGPPVKLEVTAGGKTAMSWVMQANKMH
jgi:hypothetical protein